MSAASDKLIDDAALDIIAECLTCMNAGTCGGPRHLAALRARLKLIYVAGRVAGAAHVSHIIGRRLEHAQDPVAQVDAALPDEPSVAAALEMFDRLTAGTKPCK